MFILYPLNIVDRNMKIIEENYVLLIFIALMIWAIFFNKGQPLPEGCYIAPSVDVGGSGVECD